MLLTNRLKLVAAFEFQAVIAPVTVIATEQETAPEI